MRIAITTTSGKKVDQHFGKANRFDIYDLTEGKLTLVEEREVDSYCECIDGEPVDPNHKFSDDRFSKVTKTIHDCQMLYTQQIGDIPKEKLKIIGIDVQPCSCQIDKIPNCKGDCKNE